MYRVENKDHREPYLILLSNKYIFIYGIYGPIIPNTRLNYKHDLIHKHHHTYKHTHILINTPLLISIEKIIKERNPSIQGVK